MINSLNKNLKIPQRFKYENLCAIFEYYTIHSQEKQVFRQKIVHIFFIIIHKKTAKIPSYPFRGNFYA